MRVVCDFLIAFTILLILTFPASECNFDGDYMRFLIAFALLLIVSLFM